MKQTQILQKLKNWRSKVTSYLPPKMVTIAGRPKLVFTEEAGQQKWYLVFVITGAALMKQRLNISNS